MVGLPTRAVRIIVRPLILGVGIILVFTSIATISMCQLVERLLERWLAIVGAVGMMIFPLFFLGLGLLLGRVNVSILLLQIQGLSQFK
jgi:hypothetical protein